MMSKGLPVVIIVLFTVVVVLNALLSAFSIAVPHRQAGLVTVLLDTTYVAYSSTVLWLGELNISHRFDILVSIGVPVLIVAYCLSTFSFDRRKLGISQDVYPPGWFETAASININPVQPQIIRTAFNSLRIHSVMTLFARVGSNLALCRRFYQLAALANNSTLRQHAIYPKNKAIGALFGLFAVFTVVFVEESIRTSRNACRPHPECVENVWRWLQLRDNDSTQCPCLTMIDEEPRVKTYDEWLDPKDVTEKLAQLASSGDLQMISLLNRKLAMVPDEVQQSSTLKHMYVLEIDLVRPRTQQKSLRAHFTDLWFTPTRPHSQHG